MRLFIRAPQGKLESELWLPDSETAAPAAACALAHPHPLHGGTMRNTVVHRTGRGLQAAGLAVLRFNFRGVGASQGQHSGSIGAGGEEDDLAAALDSLSERFPTSALWAGGFSFGARTAAGLALRDERIERLVLIALPVRTFDSSHLQGLSKPGLIVMGGRDHFGTASDLENNLPNLTAGAETESFPDADHFFRGFTHELQERVRRHAEHALR